MVLIHHSDRAFEVLLLLAGREQAVAARKLIKARDSLERMLELIVDLTA